ncbi:hypothetical protein [Lactiplantibacillus paraxiangfangensis]|uniref:hypothetical protein n=1 Tax=Lactiplantibacillus paraxiangfangensis TaxID=3076224 RepID=UPI0030C6E584
MKILKSFLSSYFRVLLFYIVAMYLVTAPPTGPFRFKWTLFNVLLTASYSLFYPALIYLFPHFKKPRLVLTSVGTKALRQGIQDDRDSGRGYRNSINPVASRERLLMEKETKDGLMTSELSFFIQGGLLLVAIPVLVGTLLFHLIKKHIKNGSKKPPVQNSTGGSSV